MGRRLGRVLGGAALLAVAIVVTVWVFPDHFALVFDSVTVDGTVTEFPVERSCESSRCYYADVEYGTDSGATFVRNLEVGVDVRPGDIVRVRYAADNPLAGTTEGIFGRVLLLGFFTVLGPLLLLQIAGSGLRSGWKKLRSSGEVA